MTAPDSRDSVELLPCPFCGSVDRVYYEVVAPHTHKVATFMPDYEGGAMVTCGNCCAAHWRDGKDALAEVVAAWNNRQALARGPQQAGGEVQRFRPTLQKSGQSPKGYIAVMTAKDDPRDSDWRVEESRAWVRYTDYAALQAEVARLKEELQSALTARDLAQAAAEHRGAALREESARLDYIERTFSGMTNRERYLPVTMIWGKGCNGRTLREACDKYMSRLVRDGDSGEGESC